MRSLSAAKDGLHCQKKHKQKNSKECDSANGHRNQTLTLPSPIGMGEGKRVTSVGNVLNDLNGLNVLNA